MKMSVKCSICVILHKYKGHLSLTLFSSVPTFVDCAIVLLLPCNYQLSKSIVHEIKFGDIAVIYIYKQFAIK